MTTCLWDSAAKLDLVCEVLLHGFHQDDLASSLGNDVSDGEVVRQQLTRPGLDLFVQLLRYEGDALGPVQQTRVACGKKEDTGVSEAYPQASFILIVRLPANGKKPSFTRRNAYKLIRREENRELIKSASDTPICSGTLQTNNPRTEIFCCLVTPCVQ